MKLNELDRTVTEHDVLFVSPVNRLRIHLIKERKYGDHTLRVFCGDCLTGAIFWDWGHKKWYCSECRRDYLEIEEEASTSMREIFPGEEEELIRSWIAMWMQMDREDLNVEVSWS